MKIPKQMLKGLSYGGIGDLLGPKCMNIPLLYRCKYFYVKFYPRVHWLSIFQKSYPFAVFYSYPKSDTRVFNGIDLNSCAREVRRIVDSLYRKEGSLDPTQIAVLRSKARSHVRGKVSRFLLQISGNGNQMGKIKDSDALSVNYDGLPLKYHGFIQFKFLMLPNRENMIEFDREIEEAMKRLEKIKEIRSDSKITFKGSGRYELAIDLKQGARELRRLANGLKGSEDIHDKLDVEVFKKNLDRNQELRKMFRSSGNASAVLQFKLNQSMN